MNHPLEDKTFARRIKGTAHNIARRYGSDPDDVEMDLALHLLEAYTADPEEALNDPATALDKAANAVGWQHCKAAQHADRIGVEDRPISSDLDAPALIETYASTNPWPAVNRRLDLELALARLRPADRTIAHALAAGYRSRDIGPALGMSYATVCSRYPSIRAALARI